MGNIYSKRDWCHAEDYVKGMWLMMQNKEPVDYVLATGKTYTVDDVLVYLNGVHLIPTTDYTLATDGSGVVTMTLVGGAPGAGSSLVVRYLPK